MAGNASVNMVEDLADKFAGCSQFAKMGGGCSAQVMGSKGHHVQISFASLRVGLHGPAQGMGEGVYMDRFDSLKLFRARGGKDIALSALLEKGSCEWGQINSMCRIYPCLSACRRNPQAEARITGFPNLKAA